MNCEKCSSALLIFVCDNCQSIGDAPEQFESRYVWAISFSQTFPRLIFWLRAWGFPLVLKGFLPRDASMRALWSSRQNCSHNVSQKLKGIRRFSESNTGHQWITTELVEETQGSSQNNSPVIYQWNQTRNYFAIAFWSLLSLCAAKAKEPLYFGVNRVILCFWVCMQPSVSTTLWGVTRGLTKGWFPKGWFWRMFPRNENRNEGTFAKTTLLETALLSPNDPFWCWQKGGFQKGGFGGCFPRNETALLSPSE